MSPQEEQLMTVLKTTAQFLHAQGCDEASTAVHEALTRLEHWDTYGPLTWALRDEHNQQWHMTSFNKYTKTASIAVS